MALGGLFLFVGRMKLGVITDDLYFLIKIIEFI